MNWHQVLDISLGYFIIPFVSAGVGAIVLKEHLDWLALAAIILALAAVVLIVDRQAPPAISLMLAATFVLYAYMRKTAPVDALEGMAIETLMLCRFALV